MKTEILRWLYDIAKYVVAVILLLIAYTEVKESVALCNEIKAIHEELNNYCKLLLTDKDCWFFTIQTTEV